MTILLIACLLIILAIACYHRANWNTCVGIGIAFMLLGSIIGAISTLGWLVFLALTIPLSVTSLRQQYITKPIFAAFKKVTPTMSETEKSAIDAGTTWWEADLFVVTQIGKNYINTLCHV